MALTAEIKDVKFGVGDMVRVIQNIKEGDKQREQAFEGMVMGIKGHGKGKSFTVRRMGAQRVGIERIFPLLTPIISRIELVKHGKRGVRRAKLYYTREKSTREIDMIYRRAKRKEESKKAKPKTKVKPKAKKVVKKVSTKKVAPKAKVVAKKKVTPKKKTSSK